MVNVNMGLLSDNGPDTTFVASFLSVAESDNFYPALIANGFASRFCLWAYEDDGRLLFCQVPEAGSREALQRFHDDPETEFLMWSPPQVESVDLLAAAMRWVTEKAIQDIAENVQ